MMIKNRTQIAAVAGMFGALLFFVSLLIEYRYDLFPPGSGSLFVINQIMFYVAMSGILVMLWGMRKARAGGNGRFARITLTIFPIGWAALILGGVISLISGNFDNLLFPIGGLMMIFGLLTGITVAAGKQWSGWSRFAPVLQGVYFLLVMMILPPILTGSNDPTLLTESLWMVTWFLMGLALFVNAKTSVQENYAH
jgi:hypothetical protein